MSKRDGCDCTLCRELCSNEPGWFLPEEIAVAAEYMGISQDEFISSYLEEHSVDGVIALSPRMEAGACIFLEDGHCRIHAVKPYECRKVYGCEGPRRHKRIREIIINRWK